MAVKLRATADCRHCGRLIRFYVTAVNGVVEEYLVVEDCTHVDEKLRLEIIERTNNAFYQLQLAFGMIDGDPYLRSEEEDDVQRNPQVKVENKMDAGRTTRRRKRVRHDEN